MLKNLSIKMKLIFTLTFFVVVLLASYAYFLLLMQKIETTFGSLEHDSLPSLTISKSIPTQLLSLRRYELAAAIAAYSGNQAQAEKELQTFEQILNETDKVVQSYPLTSDAAADEKEYLNNILNSRNGYLAIHQKLVTAIHQQK